MATYYFSNTGNDSNNGTSAATPWQTLTKFHATVFAAGDSVKFKNGDSWYGSLIAGQSGSSGNPINLGAYGTGAKPVISGFVTVVGWTDIGGGIWQANIPEGLTTNLNMLTLDGEQREVGRYPTTGWLTYESFGNTSITDSSLTGTPDWTGAEVVIRKLMWMYTKNKITSHVGSTLNYEQSIWDGGSAGYGYFIQNDPKCLTTFGDWYYNPITKNLQMYFGAANPLSHVVKVATKEKIIDVANRSHIEITGLNIEGGNTANIWAHTSSYINIHHNDIKHAGGVSVRGHAATHLTVEYNLIEDANDVGIYLRTNSTNSTIRYNYLTKIASLIGMVWSDNEWHDMAIFIGPTCHDANVENNVGENMGAVGISVDAANNVLVKRNFLKNTCQKLDDASAIYVGAGINGQDLTGRLLTENIVVDTFGGEPASMGGHINMCHGFYIDGAAKGVALTYNTVINANGYGYFLNGSSDMPFFGNTSFGAYVQLGLSNWAKYDNNLSVHSNVDFQENIFVASGTEKLQQIFMFDHPNELDSLGVVNHNYYLYPAATPDLFQMEYLDAPFAPVERTPQEWAGISGQDVNSLFLSYPANPDIRVEYNASEVNKVVSLDGNYLDAKGNGYFGSVTIPPYQSRILFKGIKKLLTYNNKPVSIGGKVRHKLEALNNV